MTTKELKSIKFSKFEDTYIGDVPVWTTIFNAEEVSV